MANKAFKFRAYPTSDQITFFCKSFGCVRKYWNIALAALLEQQRRQEPLRIVYPSEVKRQFTYLKEIDAHALTNTQMHLQQAFKNHVKNPKHFNQPKFKSKKKCKRSYTTSFANHNIYFKDGFIKLPKVGFVKVRIHRQISDNYVLKSATVSQDPDGKFYVSVLFEYDDVKVDCYPDKQNAVGLDYKSDGFSVSSDGKVLGSPKYFRRMQKRLATEQKRLSRKINGSENYYKQLYKVNKVHVKVRNQRKDFAHKQSAEIANRYDIVCVEDLNLKTVANKGFGNGKATNDNGFGMFRDFLKYKLELQGKVFVKIGKFYPSSQLCSYCGGKNPKVKDLSIRKWVCPSCGVLHDRDVNAAINILTEGLRIYEESVLM